MCAERMKLLKEFKIILDFLFRFAELVVIYSNEESNLHELTDQQICSQCDMDQKLFSRDNFIYMYQAAAAAADTVLLLL